VAEAQKEFGKIDQVESSLLETIIIRFLKKVTEETSVCVCNSNMKSSVTCYMFSKLLHARDNIPQISLSLPNSIPQISLSLLNSNYCSFIEIFPCLNGYVLIIL
jgi:hypothetical protein